MIWTLARWHCALLALCIAMLFPGNIALAQTMSRDLITAASLKLETDPDGAKAEALSVIQQNARHSDASAQAWWVIARIELRNRDTAAARRALEAARRDAPRGAAGNRVRGYISLMDGLFARGSGDLALAVEQYRTAQRLFLQSDDRRGQGLALQALAQLYVDAGNGDDALRYFQLAENAYQGDDLYALNLANNRAVAQQYASQHEASIANFRRALVVADRLGLSQHSRQILLGIAGSQISAGDLPGARATLTTLQSRFPSNAGSSAATDRLHAAIAFREGRFRQARTYIERALVGIDPAQSDVAYLKDHQIAYQIYSALGLRDLALRHLEAVTRLDQDSQALRSSNRAALLAAQFRFDAQEQRIERMRQEQLERDIRNQRMLNIALAIGSAVVLSLLLGLLIMTIKGRNKERAAARELAVVNRNLERALAAKADFLASTSHEIRTPLNGILGMTQVILAQGNLPAQLTSQIELVHDAGTAMRALIDDILDVAKIENGNFTVSPRATDINDVVARIVRLFDAQAHGRGLTIVHTADTLPGPAMIDPDRLTQVMFNLIGNALKFTHEGGVTVTLAHREGASNDHDNTAPAVILTVEDTGIGIPPEWHERIFEMFEQVDNSRTRGYAGTGLGLAICKQLTEAMGGTIAVTSAEGEGTRFTLIFPFIAADEAAPAGAHAPTSAAAKLLPHPVSHMGQAHAPAYAAAANRRAIIVAADMMRAALLRTIVARAGWDAVSADTTDAAEQLAGDGDALWLIDEQALPTIGRMLAGCGAVRGAAIIVGQTGSGDGQAMSDADAKSIAEKENFFAGGVTRVAFARNAIEQCLAATNEGQLAVGANARPVSIVHAAPAEGRDPRRQNMARR